MKYFTACVLSLALMGCGENEENVENYVDLLARIHQLESDMALRPIDCVTSEEMVARDTRLREMEEAVALLNLRLLDQAKDTQASLASLEQGLDAIVRNIIQTDTTWIVGSSAEARFADLFEAMEAARSVEIREGAILTLKVEDGSYVAYEETLMLNHPDGARIHIVGNEESPERVVLSFFDVRTGVEVGEGNRIGRLSGLKLLGDPGSTKYGLMVWGQSSANIGQLVVEHWGHTGVWLGWNANLWVTAAGGLETAYNTVNGLAVHTGSFAHAREIYSHDNGRVGIDMNWGGIGYMYGARMENNGHHGLDLNGGAIGYFGESLSTSNGYNGFQVGNGGFANLIDSSTSNNGRHGYHSYYGGVVRADRSTSVNNELWGWSAAINSWMRVTDYTHSGGSGAFNVGTTEDEYGRSITR